MTSSCAEIFVEIENHSDEGQAIAYSRSCEFKFGKKIKQMVVITYVMVY